LEISRNADRRLLEINNSPALGCGKPLLLWGLLPNSGNPLKLMVPNYIRKTISGWSNYSGKVTSHKMIEKEMGYRGSKSIVFLDFCVAENAIVKEQRVDGNRHGCFIAPCLRYTLTNFERNYWVKVPSNQINKSIRRYTSIANQTHNLANEINPVFLTGFSDAESNFTVRIIKCSTVKIGWTVQLCFQIGLHKKDKDLLKKKIQVPLLHPRNTID